MYPILFFNLQRFSLRPWAIRMCLTLQDGHLGLRNHGIYHQSQPRQALSGLKYLKAEQPSKVLIGVLMYNHPFSFSGRLRLVESILTFRRHLLTTYLLLWFLNDFPKFTMHYWNGLVDVEGNQSGLGPETECYLHHLSLDRNQILFLKAAKKA
ncbi:hypothetical protein BDR22DRAFT_625697 [Usnea florida]